MRRKSREIALQVLFQSEFTEPLRVEDLIKAQDIAAECPPDIQKYAKDIIHGVQVHKLAIDSIIQQNSAHWKLDRMATIDRNLLRIAVYEMKFSISPLTPAIVINEALEIAKIYSGTDSTSFINGLLDQVAKGL